ncbi:2-dehydro-3-deoxy-D-gluconate 5-dehydrogenase-like [Chironomus tepperi]|uniref:2-dehydro-3-deoxy-D-gluconate 5-dehydrogenase-like n=1 Tax=Chironomus tepperi TaxID=113505 RepID=UPI00391F3E4F
MLFLVIFCSTVVIPILFVIHIALQPIKQKLHGKVVLVTGGASGLGQQLCIKLAQKGCRIVVVDSSLTDETLRKLKPYHVKVRSYQVDGSNEEEVLSLKEKVINDFGAVDILINNFCCTSNKPIMQQSKEEVDRLTQNGIVDVMFMTKCFLHEMINRGRGQIVSISSMLENSDFGSYSICKSAMTGFMLGIANYLENRKLQGIRTMNVTDGVVGNQNELSGDEKLKRYALIKTEENADAIVDAIISNKSSLSLKNSFDIKTEYSRIWCHNSNKNDLMVFKKMIQ